MLISPDGILRDMHDPYEEVLRRFRADPRSLNAISKATGVPATTLRDLKSGHVSDPRIDTLRHLAGHYLAPSELAA